MILSLEINHQKDLDVISFFRVKNGVQCPPELWFSVIQTSLKMKHSVLLIESENTPFPQWDPSKRWQAGDNWCWLHPRALSVISERYPSSYQDFKTFLMHSK
jgi:hypothetical protein